MTFSFQQAIKKLEARKGGYFYLTIPAEVVNQYERKRATRLICTIDDKVAYSCGLNHLGNGDFFIIVSTARFKKLKKELGDTVTFTIHPDPNPLGVEVPEVLQVYLAQEPTAKTTYDQLTDGKKRSLIFTIQKVKNVDLQVEKIRAFLAAQR